MATSSTPMLRRAAQTTPFSSPAARGEVCGSGERRPAPARLLVASIIARYSRHGLGLLQRRAGIALGCSCDRLLTVKFAKPFLAVTNKYLAKSNKSPDSNVG